jgi:GTPase SAR1 family protein
MTIRHLVAEGPDGAGKSTLIRELLKFQSTPSIPEPLFVPHKRAVPSTGYTTVDLSDWVREDIHTIGHHVPSIYDRHPLISEPIYGPIIRGYLPGKFRIPGWTSVMAGRLQARVFTVFCLPPLDVVKANVERDAAGQMGGVPEHIGEIYEEYMYLVHNWAGPKLVYDYTKQTVADVLHRVAMVFGSLEKK